MKISVITVVRNSVGTVEETILSVAAQTYGDAEHVIVDGASRDGTLDVINRHRNKVSLIVSEPDRGIYDAMNKGIALATGDVIGFLNADDIYFDETVLERVATVFRESDVDACYADLVYVERENLAKIVRYWKSKDYSDGLFERGWMPAHPTFFVRRSVYQEFGNFDLEFHIQSDFELTMRFMAIHKIRTVYVPQVLVKMRMGGITNSRFSNMVRGNIEAYRACKKHGLSVTPIFFARKIASRIPQFFARHRESGQKIHL